ncbi:S1/P1 Nuclease [Chitinophaga barathri]|uniref:S1/P1 Nuclease n=1 Tax=Chitinophaga barathri TaxID=1647451 RepID=A0A3N4MM05_9BACT|nr:S1/P1 Nuclease [Chitinophaga barathri]
MLRLAVVSALLIIPFTSKGWGFFAHERINRLAVFSLPPEMMVLFKPHLEYLVAQSTAPDKRRYMVPGEGARHYIDMDRYGSPPFPMLPRGWREAVEKYTVDSLERNGVLPWHLERMMYRLTRFFMEGNTAGILKTAAELGHYIGDAYVPLHACSNHNGQYTGQHGIHGLWESRIPELFADRTFDYWTGKASYISSPGEHFWQIIIESSLAADSVLHIEKTLSMNFPSDQRYAYEPRNGQLVRNYSAGYTAAYHNRLNGMVERRLRGAIHSVASCWYTAWVNAGQPSLAKQAQPGFTGEEQQELRQLDSLWKQGKIIGRPH